MGIACAVVAAAALALLASSGPASAENMNLTVPYHQQEEGWYCAEACLEMVFDYWGEDVPQDDIGDVANETPAGGTYASDLMRAAEFSDMSNAVQQREGGGPSLRGYEQRSMGYGAYERYWEYGSYYWIRFDQLEQCVREGFPVIMLVWYDSSFSTRHFVVLKGFDDTNQTFTLHDPVRGPDQVRGMYLLDELWTCSDRWGMVVAPWSVRVDCPAMVGPGMQFDLTARVEALCPTPLRSLQAGYRWGTNPSASILLPIQVEPMYGGSMVVPMTFDSPGVAEDVGWALTVPHQEGLLTCTIRVDAEVIVYGGSDSYPYYSDVVGTSVSVTVVCDCAHPSIDSFLVEGGAEAVADPWVEVTYTASDEGGGIDAVAFSMDASGGWGPWGAPNGTMRLLLGRGDGSYTIGMRVRDAFGNAAVGYRSIDLDTRPPAIVSFVVAGGLAMVTSGDIDVRTTVEDTGSGPRQMRFRFDDSPWMPWRPFETEVWLAVPRDGTVTIEVMVVDGAGLAAGASATITIDASPPIIKTFSVEGGERYLRGGTVGLLVNASDNVATSMEWAIVCGTAQSPGFDPSRTVSSDELTRMERTFLSEGRYILRLIVRDEAGFTAESSIDVIVDGTPPTVSLDVTEGRALTNATVVSVKWLAVDAVSGLKGASLRVDAGPWRALGDMWEPVSVDLGGREGPRTLELMAEDMAGNLGKAVATIVVDTRCPTAETHPTGELPDGTVAVDTRFWVVFSEPMERASVRVVLLNGTRMNMDCTIEWLNGTSELEVRPLGGLSFSEGYTLEVVGQDPAGNALGPMRTTVLTGAAPPPPGLLVQGGGSPLALLVVLLVAAASVAALAALRRRKGGRGERAASGPRQPQSPGRPMGKV